MSIIRTIKHTHIYQNIHIQIIASNLPECPECEINE